LSLLKFFCKATLEEAFPIALVGNYDSVQSSSISGNGKQDGGGGGWDFFGVYDKIYSEILAIF
jgi:hypothetical protein